MDRENRYVAKIIAETRFLGFLVACLKRDRLYFRNRVSYLNLGYVAKIILENRFLCCLLAWLGARSRFHAAKIVNMASCQLK
jgi:hypothetical protein